MDGPVVQERVTMIKARFVGGPWHNAVREVPRRPYLDVPAVVCGDSELSPVRVANRHHLERVRYKLTRCGSDGGAVYYQYVLVAGPQQLLSEEAHS